MIINDFLLAEVFVDRYKEDPLVAADKLAEIWCNRPVKEIDVWCCDWANSEFFEKFLDKCREKGMLKEVLGVWWVVHNCPGPDTEPCYHNYVCQQVIDYGKKYGLDSEVEWLEEYGLAKFENYNSKSSLLEKMILTEDVV